MSVKKVLLEVAETIVVSVVIISIIYATIASVEVVLGASMEPTYTTGERILVDKVTRNFKNFDRGQVVVISPPNENKHYIKRIVGMPGDVFKIKDCKVQISRDGERYNLDEGSYLAPGVCTLGGVSISEGRALKLGENEYIVLGDNRPFSVDSRAFGPIGKERILGRVVFVFWPVTRIGFTK